MNDATPVSGTRMLINARDKEETRIAVVRDGRLVHADEEEIARHHRVQAGRLAS